MLSNLPLLRLSVIVILIMHSIPTIFDGTVNDFGQYYLNEKGFSPIGVPLAWAIKISHVLCAICFLINRFIKPASLLTIAILVAGIIMVHGPEGWFVVGKGRNGIEFNFLLIAVLLTFVFPQQNAKKTILQK